MNWLKGKGKDCILDLPHTAEGYAEAKKILEWNFGKDKALIQELESLSNITSTKHVEEIHEFYTKLSWTVRMLATMNKLERAQGYVYCIMHWLRPVKESMAQRDDEWEEWRLEYLVENLRKYMDRNPLPSEMGSKTPKTPKGSQGSDRRRDNLVLAGLQNASDRVYCGSNQHQGKHCNKILDVASHREFLKEHKLCHNCPGSSHLTAKCGSWGCGWCGSRYHTSLCDEPATTTLSLGGTVESKGSCEKYFGAIQEQTTLPATVLAEAHGVKAQIMLDAGAGSSYISSDLVAGLNLKPQRVTEQMYGTLCKDNELNQVKIKSDANDDFEMELQVVNTEKPVLTHLLNSRIADQKCKNPGIKRLVFSVK